MIFSLKAVIFFPYLENVSCWQIIFIQDIKLSFVISNIKYFTPSEAAFYL